MAVIHQCPNCNRQHDGAGNLVGFRGCVPEITVCGQPDCADEAARAVELEDFRRNKRLARKKQFEAAGSGAERSQPPETE
jgi:hypothetical protein